MGVKTLYEYFYKLAYGDKGVDKATLVNDCLDIADAEIKANKDAKHTQGTDYSNIVICANYDHPDDAITAIGATEATLLVTEAETCDTNFTVPANVTVRFERGGKWTINTGITVGFNGSIDAGLWQIFEYTGTGSFNGYPKITTIYPQWWGALGDGSHDDTVAIQNAIDSFSFAGKMVLYFSRGTYITTAPLELKGDIIIQGSGRGTSWIKAQHTGDCIKNPTDTRIDTWTIQDIGLMGDDVDNTGYGIHFDNYCSYGTIQRCIIYTFGNGGILFEGGLSNVISDNRIADNDVNVTAEDTNGIKFLDWATATVGMATVSHNYISGHTTGVGSGIRYEAVSHVLDIRNIIELNDYGHWVGTIYNSTFIEPYYEGNTIANTIWANGNAVIINEGGTLPKIILRSSSEKSLLFQAGDGTLHAGMIANYVSGETKIGGFKTGGYYLALYSNNAEAMRITGANAGIGLTVPTARLHLPAGTAVASTAPLKFNSGTLLTTPEVGAVEFLNDKYYATVTTDTERKEIGLIKEDTWTAVIRGQGTAGTYEIASQYSNYTKIGRVVHLESKITLAASVTGGGTSYMQITGCPFTKMANSRPIGTIAFSGIDFTGTQLNISFESEGASNILYVIETVDNGALVELPISAIGANDVIMFTITFFI